MWLPYEIFLAGRNLNRHPWHTLAMVLATFLSLTMLNSPQLLSLAPIFSTTARNEFSQGHYPQQRSLWGFLIQAKYPVTLLRGV